MEIPIANIYYLLCYAWDVLDEKDTVTDIDALESTDLLDLFGRVLANGTRRLLRRGLDRGYLSTEGELAGVRGKLLATPTLLRDLLRKGRAECVWDELEYDTLPNRILKATVERLHSAAAVDQRTRAEMRDLLRWLAPVGSLTLRSEHFRRVQLHRNNRMYSMLLHICEFVHQHWLPSEKGGGRQFRDFVRDRLAELFESFVRQFYQRELPENERWAVTSPRFGWSVAATNLDARSLLPQMEADVCLHRPGRAIILDTKFYAQAIKTPAYGSGKLSSANLYQIYTYLRQRAGQTGWEAAEGVLLYPRVDREFDAQFVTHGHRIRALTLDLTRPWQEVHRTLLSIATSSQP